MLFFVVPTYFLYLFAVYIVPRIFLLIFHSSYSKQLITFFRILLLPHFCFLISFPLEVNKTDHGLQYDPRRSLLGCEYKSQRLETYPAHVNNMAVVITALIGIFRALLNETNL
jgi:hypothetical protein